MLNISSCHFGYQYVFFGEMPWIGTAEPEFTYIPFDLYEALLNLFWKTRYLVVLLPFTPPNLNLFMGRCSYLIHWRKQSVRLLSRVISILHGLPPSQNFRTLWLSLGNSHQARMGSFGYAPQSTMCSTCPNLGVEVLAYKDLFYRITLQVLWWSEAFFLGVYVSRRSQ